MSTTCKNPCFCTCCQIRLWCPESSCNRKLRHRLLCLLTIYCIDDQSEPVAKIYKRSSYCRTSLGCKYQSCRIFSVTHGKRAHLNGNRTISNCWAYLKHMCFQNTFFARYEVICIILHERSTFCILYIRSHDLHKANHCCCLPVTFCTEAIALLHKSLDCQTRKLLETTKHTKVCHDCMIIMLCQEFLQSYLNRSLYFYMLSEFCCIPAFRKNLILAVIFICQCADITCRYSVYILNQIIYIIMVNLPAKLNLRFYLIAFCNSYIVHVVTETAYTDVGRFHNTYSSYHPLSDLLNHFRVLPVSNYDLTLDSHSADNMAIFTVSMCRLILIHEIHINGIIRNLFVELCMKMHQWLSIFLQSQNP